MGLYGSHTISNSVDPACCDNIIIDTNVLTPLQAKPSNILRLYHCIICIKSSSLEKKNTNTSLHRIVALKHGD